MKFNKIIGDLDPAMVRKAEEALTGVFTEYSLSYGNTSAGSGMGGDPLVFNLMYTQDHVCTKTLGKDKKGKLRELHTAATNGRCFYWNPEFVAKLSRIGLRLVCGHEAWHGVFMHPSRIGSRNPSLWNIAVDYKVNATQIEDIKARGKNNPGEIFKKDLGDFITIDEYTAFVKDPFNPPPKMAHLNPLKTMYLCPDDLASLPDHPPLFFADENLQKEMRRPENIYEHFYKCLPVCPECGKVGKYKLPKELPEDVKKQKEKYDNYAKEEMRKQLNEMLADTEKNISEETNSDKKKELEKKKKEIENAIKNLDKNQENKDGKEDDSSKAQGQQSKSSKKSKGQKSKSSKDDDACCSDEKEKGNSSGNGEESGDQEGSSEQSSSDGKGDQEGEGDGQGQGNGCCDEDGKGCGDQGCGEGGCGDDGEGNGCCDGDGEGEGKGCGGCGSCGDGVEYDPFGIGDTIDDHVLADVSEEEMGKRLSDAIEATRRMAGKIPGGLEDELGELIAPKLTWQDFMRMTVSKIRAGKGRNDWTKPRSRPLAANMYIPRQIKKFVKILVGIDTSGSMSPEDMAYGASQLMVIDESGEGVVVPWDTQAYWEAATPIKKFSYAEIAKIKVKGRGGTEISHFLNEYEKNVGDVDMIVIITDSYLYDQELASVRKPKCKNIMWLVTAKHEEFNPPFGRKFFLRND